MLVSGVTASLQLFPRKFTAAVVSVPGSAYPAINDCIGEFHFDLKQWFLKFLSLDTSNQVEQRLLKIQEIVEKRYS